MLMLYIAVFDRKTTVVHTHWQTRSHNEQTPERSADREFLFRQASRYRLVEIPYKVWVRANSRPSGVVHDSANLYLVIIGEEGETSRIRLRRNPKTGKFEHEFKATDVGKVSDGQTDERWMDALCSNRLPRSPWAKREITTTSPGVLRAWSSDEAQKWQRMISFQIQHRSNRNTFFLHC